MIKTILGILCFVNVAIAADVPAAGSYRDFSGGLNTYNASVALPVNESPSLMNVVIDEAGALTQRNGFQSCGQIPSGATATNLYEYVKNDGSRNLIVTDNKTIWQTADCVVYSTITTGLSSLSMPRFTTALDKLWVVNGSTYPFTWDGSTLYRLDGLDNHPLAPIGKYITYWKSRVWIAATPTAPSSVFFSLLVDSIGDILSPETSTGAWTSTNQVYFNRDDGSPVYGMKAYRDNLYVFKETGISRLIFESEYSLSVAKNVSTIGSKFNESIIEMDDGLLRFVGRDGVYAFDGSTVKRLSTRWTPTFETIRQPSQSEQYHLWDSNTDWLNNGNKVDLTTTPYRGSLSLETSSYLYDDFLDGDYNASPKWNPGEGTNLWYVTINPIYNFNVLNYKSRATTAYSGDIYSTTSSSGYGEWSAFINMIGSYGERTVYLNWYFISNSTKSSTSSGYCFRIARGYENSSYARYTLYKVTAGSLISLNTVLGSFPGSYFKINRTTDGLFTIFSSSNISSGPYYSILTAIDDTYNNNSFAQIVSAGSNGNTSYDSVEYYPQISNIRIPIFLKSSGTFTSEVTTATNVSVWKTFAVDETLNGQSIAYDIRTATSVYNTLQAPWRSITSGAVVSTTTDAYAQWRATLGTTDNGVTPMVNSASIGWMTGGSSKSTMYGINYKSRYWLASSTSIANQYNDLVMVESKSPLGTHTRYNLPISAFAIWNGNLYGAIGNTPKIARLDYGSTDDGNAIMSWWDSRDEMYDNPILYKTINLGILDYANSPANTNIQIGLSPDMGENWEYKAFNMAASTLPRNTKRLNYTANTALGFRTRIFNDTLGIGFKIYGIHNFGKMTQFAGN